MGNRFVLFLSLGLLLLMLTTIVAVFLLFSSFYLSGSGALIFSIIQGVLLYFYIQKQFNTVERHLDCMINNDFTNPLDSKSEGNSVLTKLGELNDQLRIKESKQYSEFHIFTNIIESLSLGVLILEKEEKKLTVYAMNSAFSTFLSIPKLTDWDLLSSKIESLLPYLQGHKWANTKHVVALKVNEQEENFLLKTSITKAEKSSFLILTLETVQQLIEKKEKESWYKLMNVMSHEIINTITPIHSLAENLQYLIDVDKNEIEPDDLQELSHGLSIINKRSLHLTKFVDSYRQLTSLPQPNFEWVNIVDLIQEALNLFKSNFENNNINVDFEVSVISNIKADRTQLEQVFINLIRNAISALENQKNPKLTIELTEDVHRLHIRIIDNGVGIPEEIKSNIFVPYFTTRKEGSGIGLTLSKSIINAHKGHIYLEKGQDPTVFVVSLNK